MTPHTDTEHDLLGLVPDRLPGPEGFEAVDKDRGPLVKIVVTTLGVVYLRTQYPGSLTAYLHDGRRPRGVWTGEPISPADVHIPEVGQEWRWALPETGRGCSLGVVVEVLGWSV